MTGGRGWGGGRGGERVREYYAAKTIGGLLFFYDRQLKDPSVRGPARGRYKLGCFNGSNDQVEMWDGGRGGRKNMDGSRSHPGKLTAINHPGLLGYCEGGR